MTSVKHASRLGKRATRSWKHKMEVYERCSWSEEEGLAALMTYPLDIRNEDHSSFGSSGAKGGI